MLPRALPPEPARNLLPREARLTAYVRRRDFTCRGVEGARVGTTASRSNMAATIAPCNVVVSLDQGVALAAKHVAT